jgi:putative transposase
MPRRPRFCPPGYPVHVIHRGNNRHVVFTSDEDTAAYAHWLAEGAAKYDIRVHAWVFMTNHVHLLLTPSTDHAISHLMQFIGRLYVRRFNYRYTRSGTLFEGRFKSSLVQGDRYLLACMQYIELNPVRAGLVKDPGDYRWSSYRCHAFGNKVRLWSPHSQYAALGTTPARRQASYREFAGDALTVEAIAKIRHCANTGLGLGTEAFRKQVEKMRT